MHSQSLSTAALRGLLATGDEADRCYAARALGVLRDASAIEDLAQRLRDDDIDVCIDAAEALGRIGDERAIPYLLASLANETNGEIGVSVVGALGRYAHDEAVSALTRVARERPEHLDWSDEWDDWWDMQLQAVKALGRHGNQDNADALRQLLESDQIQDLEPEVLGALATLGDAGVEILIERLGTAPANGRRRAATALGHSATPAAMRALGRALQDADSDVRIAAVGSLIELGAHQYIRAILLLLRDESPEVRAAAAKAAMRLAAAADGLPEQIAPLFDDPADRVRATALETLAQAVTTQALDGKILDRIADSLLHGSSSVACAAAMLLGKTGSTERVPELLIVLADPARDDLVRRQTALALGDMGVATQDIMEALRAGVVDRRQAVRFGALTALMALSETSDDCREAADESPLDLVVAALNGGIPVPDEADAENSPDQDTEAPLKESSPDEQAAAERPGETAGTMAAPDAVPPTGGMAPSENEVAGIPEQDAEAAVPLPDSPPPEIPDADTRPALSTLEAIAMDNVEVGLLLGDEADTPALPDDPETAHFLDLVDQRGKRAERMFPRRDLPVGDDVRRLAARILANSSRPETVAALVPTLSEKDPELRRAAAESIAVIAEREPAAPGLSDAFGVLATLLTLDQPEQRLLAARVLGNLGNRAAVPALLDALEDDHAGVRIHAIQALRQLMTTAAGADEQMVAKEIPAARVTERIAGCLEDPQSGVRLAAASSLPDLLALDACRDYRHIAVDRLVEAAFLGAGEQAREMGKALRRIGDPATEKKLLARLAEVPDSSHRRFVIEMLEELLMPRAEAREPA